MHSLNNLFKTLTHIQDDPESGYDREWKRVLVLSKHLLGISYQIQLIKMHGEYHDPRPVSMIGINIKLNPKEWKISQDHMYYDGQNCGWNFGPFEFYRSGGFGHCLKCHK